MAQGATVALLTEMDMDISMMRRCAGLIEESTARYLAVASDGEHLDYAFPIAAFVTGYVRNMTSLVRFMTKTTESAASIRQCLRVVSRALRTARLHEIERPHERRCVAAALRLDTSACSIVMNEALHVVCGQYDRLRQFVWDRVGNGQLKPTGAATLLRATSGFVRASAEPLLCYSYASLRLLVHLSAWADAGGHPEPEGLSAESTYSLLELVQNERLMKAGDPFHFKNVLRTVVLCL
jgi:hypothetical protein